MKVENENDGLPSSQDLSVTGQRHAATSLGKVTHPWNHGEGLCKDYTLVLSRT
ncbi:hypothetical protein AN958_01870 [Leucoagaricus sp. SymC.cos]|nr:hypothetical protein AN958_01870 [Leucoagaricus sp. SymC.cos]